MFGHVDPLCSTCYHPWTFFVLLSPNDLLTYEIIHNQFSTNSHRMTPVFGKNVSKFVFGLENWQKFDFHRMTLFQLVFSLNNPLFGRKISYRKTSCFDCYPSIPPSLPKLNAPPRIELSKASRAIMLRNQNIHSDDSGTSWCQKRLEFRYFRLKCKCLMSYVWEKWLKHVALCHTDGSSMV